MIKKITVTLIVITALLGLITLAFSLPKGNDYIKFEDNMIKTNQMNSSSSIYFNNKK